MKVKKTTAEVTNVNPRKEKSDDGDVLASDISVKFAVPRAVIDTLFPVERFTDQFYANDDTVMEVVYPIVYQKKIEDLRVTLHPGGKELVFEGVKIAKKMALTPQVGQYVQVECKLQVYPSRAESGRLDEMAKEYIELEIEPLTEDILDDAAEPEAKAA